jgi:hypothetical protein
MREHNDLSKDKISILENMLERRSQDLQDARSTLNKKITQVNQTIAEMGVTAETPDLFRGVYNIVCNESLMDFFLSNAPIERMLIIKEVARVNN